MRKPVEESSATSPRQAEIPHDVVNEQAVLAAVIADWDGESAKLLDKYAPDTFLAEEHRATWTALQELRRRKLAYDPAMLARYAGPKCDVDYLAKLTEMRPDAPGKVDLDQFVDGLLWDKQRATAVTGPISALLEAIRDPKADPTRVRALARQVGDSFDGGSGRGRYLAVGEELVRQQMVEIRRRIAGHAAYNYGIPGLDTDQATGERRVLPGPAPGQVTVLTAVSGCIAGDAIVELNRAGKSFRLRLSEVVRRFNGGVAGGKIWAPGIETMVRARGKDGFIRLHRLRAAYVSGQKITYRLSVEGGREVRATKDHRFLTDNGWKRLGQLCIGDKLAMDVGIVQTEVKKPKSIYPSIGNLANHPHRVRLGTKACPACYRVPTHRLVMEAHLNVLDLGDFLARVRVGKIEGLRFLDAKVWTVHHRDEDVKNFKLSNLELIERKEHARKHGVEGGWQHVTGRVGFERVVAITEYGEEATYDLEMDGEPHNFLANGFVVHNSGKTTAAGRMSLGISRHRRRVLYGAFEMGPGMTLELLACMSLGWSRTKLIQGFTQEEGAPPKTPMRALEQIALEERMHAIHPWVRFMKNPFRIKGGQKRSNERNLDTIQEHIVDSGAEVVVLDLWKRCLVDTRPEAEEDALYQQQAMAEETRTHCILLQQQRLKDIEQRPDKRPTREGIKGSSAWVEIADTIIGWHLPAMWKAVANDKIEGFILKQRHGSPPPIAVEFDWSGEHGSITGGTTFEYRHAVEESGVFGDGFKSPELSGGGRRGKKR